MLFYLAQQNFNQPQECMNNTYVLYQHLADLTLWMNETLPMLNDSIPELEWLVERLSTVLPSIKDALVSLFDFMH